MILKQILKRFIKQIKILTILIIIKTIIPDVNALLELLDEPI